MHRLQPVKDGSSNRGGVISRGNKKNFGKIKGKINKVIPESHILFWIQQLNQNPHDAGPPLIRYPIKLIK